VILSSTGLTVDPANGTTIIPASSFQVREALAGNQVFGYDLINGQSNVRDSSGVVIQTASIDSGARWVSGGLFAYIDGDGSVTAQAGPDLMQANTPYPTIFGSGDGSGGLTAKVTNFSKNDLVLKLEQCSDGFDHVPAATGSVPGRFYRWVDGVRMVGWSHDGTLDWLKVQDFVLLNIHADGLTYDHRGWLDFSPITCYQDDPAKPDYQSCGGRKQEPLWSATVQDGGLGHVDWRFPRPVPFDCGPEPNWLHALIHLR